MKWKLIAFIFLSAFITKAQMPQSSTNSANTSDSSSVSRDSSRVEFTNFQISETGNLSLQKFSYLLDRIQFYLPIYRINLINSTLGNNGLAYQNLIYKPKFNQGFNWGFETFDLYGYQAKDAIFYDAQSPFTRAFYVQGSKQEAFFQLEHTQNIGKSFNFGFSYQRINSAGIYARQNATATAFRIHSWWRPQKSNYQLLFAASYNNQVAFENGGLTVKGDSIFRHDLERNRQLLPSWLSKSRNKIFNNSIQIRQTYDLLKPSKDSTELRKRNSTIRLQHTFNYQFRRNTFDDENLNSGFYNQIKDSNLLSSVYILQQWESEAALLKLNVNNDTNSTLSWEGKAFLKQQFIYAAAPFSYTISQLVKNATNQSVGGFVKFKIKRNIQVNGALEVFYSGNNTGDSKFESSIILKTNQNISIEAGVNSFTQNTTWQLSSYISNFASWSNNFKKINYLDIYGIIGFEKLKSSLKLGNSNTGNFVFLDTLGLPNQANSSTNLFYLQLQNKLKFKRFNLQSTIILQEVTGTDVLRIPKIQLQESLYYSTLIRKTTEFRIGIDLFACSAFYANRYQVFSGLFYLQNEVKNQGLFQTDFYISSKIRRVLFFAKLENFNSGINGYNYSITRFYPIPDRAIKLGLSWTFFD
jgi:hypothetical protein